MQLHHRVAITLSGIVSALALADAVAYGVTGDRTFITDDDMGNAATALGMSLLIGATFLALHVVLRQEAARFAPLSRWARGARRVLVVSTVILAAGFLLVTPAFRAADIDSGPAYNVSGLVAMLALAATFVAAFALGLAAWRRGGLGLGGRILGAIGPVIALTAVVAVVDADWASPVYTTVVLVLGLATLGVRAEPDAATSTTLAEVATRP